MTHHGHTRVDDYYWMRDDTREDPELLAHLKAENEYADALLAPCRPLQEKLYAEIIGRIVQDDASVPYRLRGYWYYTRFEAGKDYPILARRAGSMDAPEEILLDQNLLAAGKPFFEVGDAVVSPDNRLMPAEDSVGRRQFVLRKDPSRKASMTSCPTSRRTWSADDNRTPGLHARIRSRCFKRVRHVGTPTAGRPVYEEATSFYLSISRTRSGCTSASSVTARSAAKSAARPAGPGSSPCAPRQRDIEYQADHLTAADLRSNEQAPNFRPQTLPDDAGQRSRQVDRSLRTRRMSISSS
jgi:oligopeptidase B